MTTLTTASRREVRGACPMGCPDTCSWVVTVQDGRSISGATAIAPTPEGRCA